MAANLNKNPETSKCFGIFFIKKYKNESELSFLSLNHDSELYARTRSRSEINVQQSFQSLNHNFFTLFYKYTLAGCVDTLAIQVVPSIIVIRSL